MQTNRDTRSAALGRFRRDLRVLEREIARQLEGDTACCGITLAQCHALLEIGASELSLSALASTLDLDPSTLSRTVDSLVKAGLVERKEDPADRRSLRLTLSAAGRAKVSGIDAGCNGYYAALLESLGERDRKCVMRAVGILGDAMRRQRCCAPVCGAKTKRSDGKEA